MFTCNKLEGLRFMNGHLVLLPAFPRQCHSEIVRENCRPDSSYKILQVGSSDLTELPDL